MNDYIGIDVSKSSLQVYLPKTDRDIEVENSQKGLKQLLGKLKKHYKETSRMVWIYEPTGSYSTLIKRFCHEHGIRSFIVKPSQSAAFAKTIKNRNKTDVVDARMLYRMHTIATEDEIAVPEYNGELDRLQSHIRYYRSIVKERVIKTNQLEAALHRNDDPFILRKLRTRIKALQREEKEMIEAMLLLINANDAFSRRFNAITSFKGIGNVTGVVLFDLFMRYPDASAKEITALAGLDPIEVSSGSSLKRKSRISKQGSRTVRATLFMAVLIAINHNPHMRAFYDRLKANGKHTTAAQIAVMRKMVTITFSLYKRTQMYQPERFLKTQNNTAA